MPKRPFPIRNGNILSAVDFCAGGKLGSSHTKANFRHECSNFDSEEENYPGKGKNRFWAGDLFSGM
jgi:hypothetical protein